MGTALSEKIAQQADVFAFLFEQLGDEGGGGAIENAFELVGLVYCRNEGLAEVTRI
jgi:hypothetical protein